MFSQWYALALYALAVWTVIISIYIVSERRTPAATIAWVLSLSFLPVIGFAVYFFLGPRRFDRKKRRRVVAQDAIHNINFPEAHPFTATEAFSEASFLTEMCIGSLGKSAFLRQAEFELILKGVHKYKALLSDIAAAEKHISMEYYIWANDKIGTRIRDALVVRAKAGVKVRLHLDGVGSGAAGKRFWRPLVSAGGHVVHFNRLAIRRRSGNFRTHRKIAIFDGHIAYCGGMNIIEKHSEEFVGDTAWRDTHLRLTGPAVSGLQMVFNEGWFDSTSEILEGEEFFPTHEDLESHTDCMQVVSSGPDEERNTIQKLFAAAIFAATKRVHWTIPYFVPDMTIFDALNAAALRGVDVRILVPKNNDLAIIGAASRSFYPKLIKMGVRVFEYCPAMVHSKTLIVDETVAIVGTANADNRSFRLNFEVVIASYEGALCRELEAAFETDLNDSVEVTQEVVANYSRVRRFGQSAARLISPLV